MALIFPTLSGALLLLSLTKWLEAAPQARRPEWLRNQPLTSARTWVIIADARPKHVLASSSQHDCYNSHYFQRFKFFV